jgi:hypothetical protein
MDDLIVAHAHDAAGGGGIEDHGPPIPGNGIKAEEDPSEGDEAGEPEANLFDHGNVVFGFLKARKR